MRRGCDSGRLNHMSNMTRRDKVLALLAEADEDEPAFLAPNDLDLISVEDVPPDAAIEVGVEKEGVRHIEWEGRLHVEGGALFAHGQ